MEGIFSDHEIKIELPITKGDFSKEYTYLLNKVPADICFKYCETFNISLTVIFNISDSTVKFDCIVEYSYPDGSKSHYVLYDISFDKDIADKLIKTALTNLYHTFTAMCQCKADTPG